VVDGGAGVTSVFEIAAGKAQRSAATLRLISQRPLAGGVQWLRYRVTPEPPRRG
jgi:hypothetical protein